LPKKSGIGKALFLINRALTMIQKSFTYKVDSLVDSNQSKKELCGNWYMPKDRKVVCILKV